MRIRQLNFLLSAAVLLLIGVQPVLAQRGKLLVRVHPREAYIYADGKPVVEARGHFVNLDAGEHKIAVYNYGYKPESHTVTIFAKKLTILDVTMEAVPGTVAGPWGCITLEGALRAAVLLNGREPEAFLVGHGDEFNNAWGWKQELIVPPGKYDLTVEGGGHDTWTSSVDVPANQRVVVDAFKGVRKTVPWTAGEKASSLPRFTAGQASATAAIQKVTGQFAASTPQINCGDSSNLTWSSEGAGKTELNGSPVAASGNQSVQPKQTTAYKFTAAGPGGVYTSDATVNVNTAIPASLSVSPGEVRYHKKGDTVDQPISATLTWSAANADNISLDPLGTVGTSGNRQLQIAPSKTSEGPVDETVTYTLRASNTCGGSESRTAMLHITGSIEPAYNMAALEQPLVMNSIYFPTAKPTAAEPSGGLVDSQQAVLRKLASDFNAYLKAKPDAQLNIIAHADMRGAKDANMALSERRAERVKNFLVDAGVPASAITTKGYGEERNLTEDEVKQAIEATPGVSEERKKELLSQLQAIKWFSNRRVDITLSTTGQQSQRWIPHNDETAADLLAADPSTRWLLKNRPKRNQ